MDRIFIGRKYQRTYISGSSRNEIKAFYDVQDTDGNYENCDWINLRRMVITKYDDILHVMLSWENLLFEIGIGLILLSLIFFYFIPLLTGIFLGLSILSQITRQIVFHQRQKKYRDYNFALTMIISEIKKRFSLELTK